MQKLKHDFQPDINAVSEAPSDAARQGAPNGAEPFDFGRVERISKSQLRALQLVHENFVRNLASSLAAYLRSYVTVNVSNLEQRSYSEFLEGLTGPTCIAYLGLLPSDASAVLELSSSLVFALIPLLLGSKGRSDAPIQRKMTEIEKNLLQTLIRLMLRDLSEAWKTVAEISFSLQSLTSEPQVMHVLAPAEAVIVIAMEMRVGSGSGSMNLAIPSIFVKRLRHKFNQSQNVRKTKSTYREQLNVGDLLRDVDLALEVRLDAGAVSMRTLCDLVAGDVLMLEQPLSGHVNGFLNGQEKCSGQAVRKGERLAFEVNTIGNKA